MNKTLITLTILTCFIVGGCSDDGKKSATGKGVQSDEVVSNNDKKGKPSFWNNIRWDAGEWE